MIIGDTMSEPSLMYDLEEGEILDDEDEVNIEKNFHSPCHIFEDNFHNSFHLGTENYPSLREANYPEKLYLSSPENYLPKHNVPKYPRIQDISKKDKKLDHSTEYYQPNVKKLAAFKIAQKSRSRSCSISSSSSSSSSCCSCSSCTCSESSLNKKKVQPSSHSTDGLRNSKSTGKIDRGKKNLNQPRRKKEAFKSSEKKLKKERTLKNSKIGREKDLGSNNNKAKKLDSKEIVVSRSTKSYRHCLPEKSAKKQIGSHRSRTKSKIKSPTKREKISSSHPTSLKNDSFTDAAVDKGNALPKLIPGSLGEMLLKKQLKRELKKDSVLSSEKGALGVQEQADNSKPPTPSIDNPAKSFEVVDLCNDNEDESEEEDELTLRIMALRSAMKTRGLIQDTINTESNTLDNRNCISSDAGNKVGLKESENGRSDCHNSINLIFKTEIKGKELNAEELEAFNNSFKIYETNQDYPLSKFNCTENNSSKKHGINGKLTMVEDKSESENGDHLKMMKDKSEISSIDMDISNDSFGDNIPAQEEINEYDHNEMNASVQQNQQESRISCQDSGFPIPVEWAYMIPPPSNTDQPNDNNLNSIRNWCFNQNMYVQSMQESVNNLGPEESWKSAEANSYEVDSYNSNTATNYYYQQPLVASEAQSVLCDDYHCDYNSSLVTPVDTSMQPDELRDCHAEQYKSFMSTVIQNKNNPPVSHKKEQHRDLINIDLKPKTLPNSDFVSIKPDKKLNVVKRKSRRRRRSNRKSGSGNSLLMVQKNTQENAKPDTSIIDDDEDLLRAMLLNELSLKNQKVNLDINKQKVEVNNNNNNKNIKKKHNNNRNERLVKVGKSLEISISNQNKFNKSTLNLKGKWPVDRRLVKKKLPNSNPKPPDVTTISDRNEVTSRNFSLPKYPQVKPVIINIKGDSDSEEENERKVGTVTNCEKFISGIDSFIRNLRNKQTIAQENSTNSPTVLTPKVVSQLSQEKQEEYRRLKQLMISKRKALQMKSKKAQTLLLKKSNSCKSEKNEISVKERSADDYKASECNKENEQNNESNLNDIKVELKMEVSNEGKNLSQCHDTKGEETSSISVSANTVNKKIDCKVHDIEFPIMNTQISSVSQGNETCELSKKIEAFQLKTDKNELKNEIKTLKMSEENNFKDTNLLERNESSPSHHEKEEQPSGCSLETKVIFGNNLQSPLVKSESKLNEYQMTRLISNIKSNDSSEESSSSDTETSSSSSSTSNDSDTVIEEQSLTNEIEIRNRLLQKMEKQHQKSNEGAADSDGQVSAQNHEQLICEQTIESLSVGSQDEIDDVSPYRCKNTNEEKSVKELKLEPSKISITNEEKKDNKPMHCVEYKDEMTLQVNNALIDSVLLNSLADNVEKKVAETISSSDKHDTKNHLLPNPDLKKPSIENEVSSSQHSSKEDLNIKETLQEKEAKTQDNLAKTLGKLQQEMNNRITSVETVTSKISDLFLEAEKEDSYCQTTFSGIIKLLSKISELRKSRKEKKSKITGAFAKIIRLLEKVDEDLSFVSKMENLLLKRYNINQLPLMTNLKTKKKEQEEQRKEYISKVNQLKECLRLLDSQENILNKTFSKPLEGASSRITTRRGTTLIMQPPQQHQKKKLFKLDNRQIIEKRNTMNNNTSKWQLNNNVRSTSLSKSTTSGMAKISDSVKRSQQNKTAENQHKKQPTTANEVVTRKEVKQPQNDKLVGDIMLCPYDLLGRCNDDQCIYQHVSVAAVGQVKSNVLCSFESAVSDSQSKCDCDNVEKNTNYDKVVDSSKVVDRICDSRELSTSLAETQLIKPKDCSLQGKEESSSATDEAASNNILKQNINEYEVGKKKVGRKRKSITNIPFKSSKFSRGDHNTKIYRTFETKGHLPIPSSSLSDVSISIPSDSKTPNRRVTVIFDDQSSPEKDGERIFNPVDEPLQISRITSQDAPGNTSNSPQALESTAGRERPSVKRRGRKVIVRQNRVNIAFNSSRVLRSRNRVIEGNLKQPVARRK